MTKLEKHQKDVVVSVATLCFQRVVGVFIESITVNNIHSGSLLIVYLLKLQATRAIA